MSITQSCRVWRKFTVIALDLRGMGGSTAPPAGYDAANMAEDVASACGGPQTGACYIVGHDIGGIVAYAFARRYPQVTRGAMILDAPIPGIEGWDEIQGDPGVWHIRFMQVPGLPENLSQNVRPTTSVTSSASANSRRATRPIM